MNPSNEIERHSFLIQKWSSSLNNTKLRKKTQFSRLISQDSRQKEIQSLSLSLSPSLSQVAVSLNRFSLLHKNFLLTTTTRTTATITKTTTTNDNYYLSPLFSVLYFFQDKTQEILVGCNLGTECLR